MEKKRIFPVFVAESLSELSGLHKFHSSSADSHSPRSSRKYEIMQIHILGGERSKRETRARGGAAFVQLNGSLGFFRSYRCGCCVRRYAADAV